MLKKITLIVNYGEAGGHDFEFIPAWLTDEERNRAAFIYEGRIHFSEIRSTHDKRIYFEGERSLTLGETSRNEIAIFEFFEKLRTKSAYDFLAIDMLKEWQENFDYEFISDEGR